MTFLLKLMHVLGEKLIKQNKDHASWKSSSVGINYVMIMEVKGVGGAALTYMTVVMSKHIPIS